MTFLIAVLLPVGGHMRQEEDGKLHFFVYKIEQTGHVPVVIVALHGSGTGHTKVAKM